MRKQIKQNVAKVDVSLHNGITIIVKSYARAVMSSSRVGARVVSCDPGYINTMLLLKGSFHCGLSDGSRELVTLTSEKGEKLASYSSEDLHALCVALATNETDRHMLVSAVTDTRRTVALLPEVGSRGSHEAKA